eukprot:scaffold1996_cov377-Prasinococcus_capsulatus_cf.AAC.9
MSTPARPPPHGRSGRSGRQGRARSARRRPPPCGATPLVPCVVGSHCAGRRGGECGAREAYICPLQDALNGVDSCTSWRLRAEYAKELALYESCHQQRLNVLIHMAMVPVEFLDGGIGKLIRCGAGRSQFGVARLAVAGYTSLACGGNCRVLSRPPDAIQPV